MTDTCRCGRDVRMLNEASDDAKCVGCGRYPDQCTCTRREASGTEIPN